MRDARGGEAIVKHVQKVFGVEPRVIGGDEEAELTFSGALVGLSVAAPDRELTVFDIGGGSTEIVTAQLTRAADGGQFQTIRYKKSFDVGSVRLTERHVRTDPPSRDELTAIRNQLRATFAELPPLPEVRRSQEPTRNPASDAPSAERMPIGIAGTVTTLAAISLNMAAYDATRVHGHRLATGELRRVVELLASLPLAERRNVVGLEPKRADVIVAGGLIALTLLEQWGAESMMVSDRGVRWGLAVALTRSAATL